MLNEVKHLAGDKVGFSALEQILPCGQNDSRSGFDIVLFTNRESLDFTRIQPRPEAVVSWRVSRLAYGCKQPEAELEHGLNGLDGLKRIFPTC